MLLFFFVRVKASPLMGTLFFKEIENPEKNPGLARILTQHLNFMRQIYCLSIAI